MNTTDEMDKMDLKTLRKDFLIVGISGHEDLTKEAKVADLITRKIEDLRSDGNRNILMITSNAQGADQIAIAQLKEGDELINITLSHQLNNEVTLKSNRTELKKSDEQLVFENITGEEKTGRTFKSDEEGYEEIGRIIVKSVDHLIVIWDGVDSGLRGGTSDVVHFWRHERSYNGRPLEREVAPAVLHHLICPRESNPHPVTRWFLYRSNGAPRLSIFPPKKAYTWHISRKPPLKNSRWQSTLDFFNQYSFQVLFSLFMLIAITYYFGGLINDWKYSISYVLCLVFIGIVMYTYIRLKDTRQLYRRFIYPTLLALLTLIIGALGFSQINNNSFSQSIFSSVNLITMGSSVDPCFQMDSCDPYTPLIKFARIIGALTAIYAFFLAFSLAAGRESIDRLKFWFYRSLYGGDYSVVIGDGSIASHLVIDLLRDNVRVVYLCQTPNAYVGDILKDTRIFFFSGNMTYSEKLKSIHTESAREVFVVSDDDDENFRITQELALIHLNNDREDDQWYIHMADHQKRNLLQQISRQNLNSFSVEERIASRLLRVYPLDRFTEWCKKATVHILGFSNLSRAILRQILLQGHYGNDRELTVHVYSTEDDKKAVIDFRALHPFIDNHPLVSWNIQFHDLPLSVSDWSNPNSALYKHINKDCCTTIYACLNSTVESINLLSHILPRLAWIKSQFTDVKLACDIQVFGHYNFPDLDDELHASNKLNQFAPHIPVRLFGNLIHECSAESIKEEKQDEAARCIALLYGYIFDDQWLQTHHPIKYTESDPSIIAKSKFYGREIAESHQESSRKYWDTLLEADRASNRQAADHGWIKMRLADVDVYNEELDHIIQKINESMNLEKLGAIEHQRWNAEKIYLGWHEFPNEEQWKEKKAELKSQLLHHFLRDEIPPEEQDKDKSQIVALPYFFKEIIK